MSDTLGEIEDWLDGEETRAAELLQPAEGDTQGLTPERLELLFSVVAPRSDEASD